MSISEIKSKSIIRKYKKIDSWFLSKAGMNLYRGCLHNCSYCDGRNERYFVTGEFGKDAAVKINAPEILSLELNPERRRKPFLPGYIMTGGGVGDSYQPLEKKYGITRKTLNLCYEFGYPVHLLTKSVLIMKDADILSKIQKKSGCLLSFSFSSMDDDLSAIFEPGVPPPSERFKVIEQLKDKGFVCGIFLMPVIPFITDTKEQMEKVFSRAGETELDYIIFSGMTLKEGRQKRHFYKVLGKYFPNLIPKYETVYKDEKWGNAIPEYYRDIHDRILPLAEKYSIPLRIPPRLFPRNITINDRIILILEHLEYYLKLRGNTKTPYGFAANSISKLSRPLSEMESSLKSIPGVGEVTERLIKEILRTGKCTYLDKLKTG